MSCVRNIYDFCFWFTKKYLGANVVEKRNLLFRFVNSERRQYCINESIIILSSNEINGKRF